MSLPAGSRRVFDAAEVDAAVDRIAVALATRLWDAHPLVVCMMTGGLQFTADLLRRFHFDLELDYVHLARYDGRAGGVVRFERALERPLAGRTVLLVDDVLDEGATLRAAKCAMRERGATALAAVLVRKNVPQALADADFVALEAPNEFLVGRGMDCGGAFRQLSDIHALPPKAMCAEAPR